MARHLVSDMVQVIQTNANKFIGIDPLIPLASEMKGWKGWAELEE